MVFTERNTVEYFFIRKLSGANLATDAAEDDGKYNAPWQYISANQLTRNTDDILLEAELKQSLCRLNPEIAANPSHADTVIRKLRALLITVNSVGLVRTNEKFADWLCGKHSEPFGAGGNHCTVKLIDFDDIESNSFILTNQLTVRTNETKILDLVLFINGIPVVVGELKTPVRPAVSWLDGAHEIRHVYENAIPQLFVPNILSFACDGTALHIGAVRTLPPSWAPWRIEDPKDELKKLINLQGLGQQLTHLLRPSTLLDILRFYSVYSTDRSNTRNKIICRYQQYECANALVQRVLHGQIKKGLIWHFQGSGKSLLMLFAAQKLRQQAKLGSPTVLIVVDRIDLDSQITASFAAADVANFVTANNIKELKKLLASDTRKIIITMIHKFKDAPENLNKRKNIIVMVDEAHRTQEGNLGITMRAALPNAFLFGLTGTPINKSDRNTFWAFGASEDANGYMSRYTFQDSLRDEATLKLHFEPRLPNYHIEQEQLDAAFAEMANDLSEEDRARLSKKAASMNTFLTSPKRVQAITKDIVSHFNKHVAPAGFKAMVVTPDRSACVQYKEALDKLIPPEQSRVVISTSANDLLEFKEKWGVDKDAQEKIIEEFNQPDSSLKFLIVTAKLLTGFDSPILQTMYLDKSLKDHTLLQAICRTNRLFPNKTFGRIVDYFGVFDDTAKALSFDEESVQTVITNLKDLKNYLPQSMKNCLAHFPGVDRSASDFVGLEAAQNAINTDEKRDAFAKDFSALSKLWEALSPDETLQPFRLDYKWLAQVYNSVKPSASDHGRLLWHALGAQTTALIHKHIEVGGVNDGEEIELDAGVIERLMDTKDSEEAKKLTITLIHRFKKNASNPTFKALGKRLEELRNKAEQGLINSVKFIKELCEIAKETLQAERKINSLPVQKTAKAALTELFLEMKTEKTPIIVERIVTEIDDEIVKIVRFDGWQATTPGERKVKQALRKTLLKYQLHKDEELFERVYGYIKQYY